jgi:hypothetical protein
MSLACEVHRSLPVVTANSRRSNSRQMSQVLVSIVYRLPILVYLQDFV